jgi:hypothetical protein
VAAGARHLRLAFVLVATVAHVLRVGLLIRVRTSYWHTSLWVRRLLDAALSDLELRQQHIICKLIILLRYPSRGAFLALESLKMLVLLHLVGELLDLGLEEHDRGFLSWLQLALLIEHEHRLHCKVIGL